ncbi:hypothetical protein [Stenotrophomonas sepilia]|uniref:hypothetical protein n=1 Tax=Stenotrophomonas sepilia TaxID=2860290 RepID=UPI002E761DAE|nr:hypothetical protein [Stenotrophomonas sepilia]
MTTPYENQILGAFLFALGIECGRSGKFLTTNLFQQTPLDTTFGDLVIGAEWCLALEFKREEGTIDSEKSKWSEAALQAFERDSLLMIASRKAHLLCFSRPASGGIGLISIAYATALGLDDSKVEISCDQLIKGIVKLVGETPPARNNKVGLPPDELETYLRKLAAYRKQGGGSREATWVAVAKSGNGFKFKCASSLEQLVEPRQAPVRSLVERESRSAWRDPSPTRHVDEHER